MNTLKLLFSYYWRLSLLKETPENSPYSVFLLVVMCLLFSIIMLIQWDIAELDFSRDWLLSLMMAISLILSFIFYTYAILKFQNLASRLVQTATCLLSAYIIIHVLATPLFLIDTYLSAENLKNPIFLFMGMIYLFITLGLSIWQFVITAHIYKFALSTTPVKSVLAAFGLVAVNILTISFWR
ncbi:TPA: hypothetical protein RG395_002641 [Legionella pneumophila]|uniref:Yip1 domain-containing protein n=1 Tax=Legionella pneumophila TaxID=446 RepID=A0AAN5P840_LEGPN|nr:hypothetical protein [Legionella pneumophila]HAT1594855.1 hypothetical protein [Legionella pneumophila]HAT1971481.1 hypothetical protein [Legionella pneumophila]HAT3977055.1 hypothetical protein [Legionella pneumophila]HAT6955412.1 hypothetical protein [Legionella pneumophila]HAT8357364.1 hypothetical protein [Legionella pneumophila]